MNKIHRTVWSASRQAFVVASESAKSKGKPSSTTRKAVTQAVAAALLALGGGQVLAADLCTTASTTIVSAVTNGDNCALGNGESVSISGTGSITTTTANSPIQVLAGTTSAGSVINDGTLLSNGSGPFGNAYGIEARDSSISGSIINTGTIAGTHSHFGGGGYGIAMLDSATLGGNIFNSTTSGVISGSGGTLGFGVYISKSTVAGSIVNTGTIQGIRASVVAHDASRAAGPRDVGAGIFLYQAHITTGITNSGTISGNDFAIYVSPGNTSSSLGSLVITGNNTAKFIGAVYAPDTPVTVASGATYTMDNNQLFTLNGTSTGFTVAGTGTLAVAAGGTATITGNYTQEAAATFRTNVTNDTTYGKLVVSGTATLPSNAKIDVNVANADFDFTTTAMADIISAGTLVSDGSFAVTHNSNLFDFSAIKDGNTVDLVIAAAAASGGTSVSDIVTSTGNTPAAGAAAALDQIFTDTSNPITQLFIPISSGTDQEISNAVSQTLPVLTGGSQVAATSALSGINRVIQARQEANRGLSSGEVFYGDKKFWMKPFASWADQNDRKGVSGYDAKTAGLAFGADATISDQTRIGLAFAYVKADADSNSRVAPSQVDVDVFQLVGYGSYALDAATEINFQAGIGQNNNKAKRSLPSFGLAAEADYKSLTATLGAGVGRTFKYSDKTSFTPSVRFDYSWVKDDSYREKGANVLNLNVKGRTTDELIFAVDGKLSHEISLGTTLSANLGLGYDVINDRASITSAYAGAPGVAFTTQGLDPSPWMVRGGLGLSTTMQSGVEISARYDVDYREDFLNQTASVKVRWAF